jgi:hypothetical protein
MFRREQNTQTETTLSSPKRVEMQRFIGGVESNFNLNFHKSINQ